MESFSTSLYSIDNYSCSYSWKKVCIYSCDYCLIFLLLWDCSITNYLLICPIFIKCFFLGSDLSSFFLGYTLPPQSLCVHTAISTEYFQLLFKNPYIQLIRHNKLLIHCKWIRKKLNGFFLTQYFYLTNLCINFYLSFYLLTNRNPSEVFLDWVRHQYRAFFIPPSTGPSNQNDFELSEFYIGRKALWITFAFSMATSLCLEYNRHSINISLNT